jgi:DNA-binding transcriptional LysR family regulator
MLMRNLNLDQLQTLIAIADLGTFAAAAQALHLAAPTISMHIQELESRLQVPLVVRGRRQASLTPAGTALVLGARTLLSATDDLVEQVRRRAEGREGVVKLGTSAGVSAQLLPQVLEVLARQSPGVDVKLEILGSAEAMVRLQAGTLDIGIVAMPQAAVAGVRLTPWRNDPMVAFLPSSWEVPDLVTPEWLASRRWISFTPMTQMYRLIAGWFGMAGHNPRPYMELNYPAALKSLVAAGHSAAILPLEHPHDAAADPGIQVRHLDPALVRPMGIAHRVSALPNTAIANVMEALRRFASSQGATPEAQGDTARV